MDHLEAEQIQSLQSENLFKVRAFVYDWIRILQIPFKKAKISL